MTRGQHRATRDQPATPSTPILRAAAVKRPHTDEKSWAHLDDYVPQHRADVPLPEQAKAAAWSGQVVPGWAR